MEQINDPTGRFLLRTAGGVLSWVGIGLLALLIWLISAALDHPRVIDEKWIAICVALLVVGAFCALVGFRMFLNRPNKYGSVLSPIGWNILGSVFAAGALVALATLPRLPTDPPESLLIVAVGGLIVFSLGSFYMARETKRVKANAL